MPQARPDQFLVTFSMTGGTGAYTGPFTEFAGYTHSGGLPLTNGDTVKVVVAAVTSSTNLTRTGQWEEYEGVYSSGGSGSVSRVRLIGSSTGSQINWANPTTCVMLIGPLGEDFATICDVQTFTASGTWTKPTNAEFVQAVVIGPGGGGGGGRRGAAGSNRAGGSGGGGGGISLFGPIPADGLPSTVAVTVGNFGVGGAAATANDTSGGAPTAGTASSFGSYATANAGGAGQAGNASGGRTGGTGGTATTTIGTTITGSAGGDSSTTAPTAGGSGTGPGGGGAGGCISSADVAGDGTAGGNRSSLNNGTGAGTAGTSGASGGTGGSVDSGVGQGGAGGGGGGASKVAVAGSGGTGGNYGAGGGGGGASLNGFNSGAGGNGGPGIVIVVTYTTGVTGGSVLSPFLPSGANAATGLVPNPGSTAGTERFLCEDATFKVPSGNPNLLVNSNFLRMPQQARATLTSYATAASGTSADQFATNWGVQHDTGGTNVQFRNWSQGDSSPPVAFNAGLGSSYLQLRNFSVSTAGIAIYQFLEANGPDGLSAVSLQGQQVTVTVKAIAGTGTPTLKIAIREWQGTTDAPTRPVASWSGNVPTFQSTSYAGVGTGSGTLNTSTPTTVTATGTPTTSCVGLYVVVYVEGLPSGHSLYLSQASLTRGSTAPAVWQPHPSDEEMSNRYCFTPGPTRTIGFPWSDTKYIEWWYTAPTTMRASPSLFTTLTFSNTGFTPTGSNWTAATFANAGALTASGGVTYAMNLDGQFPQQVFGIYALAGTSFTGTGYAAASPVILSFGPASIICFSARINPT